MFISVSASCLGPEGWGQGRVEGQIDALAFGLRNKRWIQLTVGVMMEEGGGGIFFFVAYKV